MFASFGGDEHVVFCFIVVLLLMLLLQRNDYSSVHALSGSVTRALLED